MNPITANISEWRENPVKFVRDNFSVDPEEWQCDVLMKCGGSESIARRRIGMKACTGPGKSAVLSWIGWHRLACFGHRGEHPKGAALSGEGRDNLRDNLWAEISKWQQRSPFLMGAFQWTKEQVFAKEHQSTWFLSARSYPKDADQEAIGTAISGLHSKFPFILLDETGNMPTAVGQKASQIFTGGVVDGLIAAAGNPTSTTGLLYAICKVEADLWNIVTITADPKDPKRTKRVEIEHAQEMIDKYGRDNPWVMATILGEFPSTGFNTLISIDDVHRAMRRKLGDADFMYSQKRLGVDVARFGDDSSVIFPRQGLATFSPVIMLGANTTEVADRVLAAKMKWNSEMEFVDGTGGYGAGVIDRLRLSGQTPLEISFSSKASDERYLNKRAEMWFLMADWIKKGGCLPNIGKLAKELSSPTYTFTGSKFQLEPKEQIKSRLGFSPDIADALALTFAIPEAPANRLRDLPMSMQNALGSSKMVSDVDPFDNRNS